VTSSTSPPPSTARPSGSRPSAGRVAEGGPGEPAPSLGVDGVGGRSGRSAARAAGGGRAQAAAGERHDPARRLAFDVLRSVTGDGAYANLALAKGLAGADLDRRGAALCTELVAGTCRWLLVYDRIIERAGGRPLVSLQPAAVDLLRLGTHQALALRLPAAVAVSSIVDLTRATVGQRLTGLVNAVLRRVAARSLADWLDDLAQGLGAVEALALRTGHPTWIAQVVVDLLGADEAALALAADNRAVDVCLAVRPGLMTVDELRAESAGAPGRWSPFAVATTGDPGRLESVRTGRAGAIDEGGQLVAWALSWPSAPAGPWLDLCAGPGGKAALLAGLARATGERLVANELSPHRAQLVGQALRAFDSRQAGPPAVVTGDGRRPPWRPGTFARILVDGPCTGLGALRRRPDARWRKTADDLAELVPLQRSLLASALDLARSGGVVAYATCSPHPAETVEVVESVLGARGDVDVIPVGEALPPGLAGLAGDSPYLQLWPHRHGTDAMFVALLRRQ